MQYSIPILLSIAKLVEQSTDGVGRITPLLVFAHLNNAGAVVSLYKVRQMFAECKEDGLLTYHANHYRLNTQHPLVTAFVDAVNRLEN